MLHTQRRFGLTCRLRHCPCVEVGGACRLGLGWKDSRPVQSIQTAPHLASPPGPSSGLFRDRSGNPQYFVPNALMFGSTAAVYAFNRVSRSLWFLMNKFLLVPCAVYFDDYPMFCQENSAESTDHLVSDFLDLLGWRHDRTGPKGKPFAPAFDVLGLTINLSRLGVGKELEVMNKEGSAEKIAAKVQAVQRRGKMTLPEAQEIHGLLNFANGHFSGRALKYACFKIFSLVSHGESSPPSLGIWCEDVLSLLSESKPRKIPLGLDTKKILIFTDGSWEDSSAGLGAVIINESSGPGVVIQDMVRQSLLDLWKDLVGDHLIWQIELFAAVLVRWEFQMELSNKRVLLFIDNNSARGCILKGRSASPTMDDLVKAFYAAESSYPSFWWVERVPSKSNPADEPSRSLGRRAAESWKATFKDRFACQALMAEWLVKAAAKRTVGLSGGR